MKKDLNHHQNTYLNWKEEAQECGVDKITKRNSDLLIKYILDMEIGQNIARRSKKGGRSYGRLNVSRKKLAQVFRHFESKGITDITKVKEKQLHEWADDLYKGKIKREIDGKPYDYPVDFIRVFKAFWHWWMKINRKDGKQVLDICEDLSLETPENKFVYIKKEEVDEMLPYFNEEEQILIMFLFDSMIRFPTEVSSLTAKNVYEKGGEIWIEIPQEVSKTFGRTFNLLYCGDALMKFIKKKELKPNDYIFNCIRDNNTVGIFNKKLKQVAVQVFGDKISHSIAKEPYSCLSGYDFRHSGSVHLRWLASRNGKISLDSIRQRGGWVDFKMLNYYTKFLGIDGKISKDEILIEEDKSRMEKQIEDLKQSLNQTTTKTNEQIKMMEDWQDLALKYMKITPEDKELLKSLRPKSFSK